MTTRSILLKVHLWLGVVGSIFLVVLGLTGSVMAFENDIDHWLHPSLYYVQVRLQRVQDAELIHLVERRFAPARVVSLHIFRQPDLAVVAQLNDASAVFLNPYEGRILGRTTGPSATGKLIGYIHQLHTHLVPNPTSARMAAAIGGVIVQVAGFILCLLVPIGVVLWLRTKRTSIAWRASWFRVCFDAHHVIGIYAALFLLKLLSRASWWSRTLRFFVLRIPVLRAFRSFSPVGLRARLPLAWTAPRLSPAQRYQTRQSPTFRARSLPQAYSWWFCACPRRPPRRLTVTSSLTSTAEACFTP